MVMTVRCGLLPRHGQHGVVIMANAMECNGLCRRYGIGVHRKKENEQAHAAQCNEPDMQNDPIMGQNDPFVDRFRSKK
jgi:surface antigen